MTRAYGWGIVSILAASGILGSLWLVRNDTAETSGPPFARPDHPSITWVSTDREELKPLHGEQVRVQFRVSAPGEVEVRIWDPFNRLVRTLRHDAAGSGDQHVSWDGRDEGGELVPEEAYVYTIHLLPRGSREEVVFDLRGLTGGEYVPPLYRSFDEKTGRISFGLPQKSRVHLLLNENYVPRATRRDWTPALGGAQEVLWGEETETSPTVPRGAFLRAMALPENVVLVSGTGKAQGGKESERTGVPYRLELTTKRPQYHHARHPRSRCYDPKIEARVLSSTEGTTLRLSLSEEQGRDLERPDSRVSVHLYLDGKLVLHEPKGYLPYHWTVDPGGAGPGEHEVTAIVSWREEHTGIVHANLRLGAPSATDGAEEQE